jgi:hypothetical protein
MRSRKTVLAAVFTLLTLTVHADVARKRALLIGINDYSASTLGAAASPPLGARTWPNLEGTLNDVKLMRGLLEATYVFKHNDIVALTDQQATRSAILRELERLEKSARKDDVVLFYYSGHGSQVRNSCSAERDKLDESIVPADSRLGADDIRDKELRALFNKILGRGAKLTIVLDTCHSGSGVRGLDAGRHARVVSKDPRDVADPSTGPRPEDRGALVLSATQDFDRAYEIFASDRVMHGAFTWALACALKDAPRGEPMSDTFLRIQARLSVDQPGQVPVLAANSDVSLRPFLGEPIDKKNRRPAIAVGDVRPDGTYVLQGGWVNGVTEHSELRVAADPDLRLEVQTVDIATCTARIVSGRTRSPGHSPLATGTLLEIAAWAAPPSRPLRIWIPRVGNDAPLAFAQKLRETAATRKITWVTDPTETTATHLIRWRDGGWEVVADGNTKRTDTPLDGLASEHSVFVQLPAPAKLAAEIAAVEGVELTERPEIADYILAGRLAAKDAEYAFIRPQASTQDTAHSALPVRTAWTRPKSSFVLEDALIRLQRIHGWHELTSPAGVASDYTLAIRRADDHVLIEDGVLRGERPHYLVLRVKPGVSEVYTRYVYAFVIDSNGASTLLFPRMDSGSVENRLPLTRQAAKAVRNPETEIPLDDSDPFIVTSPYGADTYFLLSTSEPLSALGSLEWSGVRGGTGGQSSEARPQTPLERLLARTLSGSRGKPNETPLLVPTDWSFEKVIFHSVPPRRTLP